MIEQKILNRVENIEDVSVEVFILDNDYNYEVELVIYSNGEYQGVEMFYQTSNKANAIVVAEQLLITITNLFRNTDVMIENYNGEIKCASLL